LEDIQVKIADLGNACWVHRHFTEDIQTRQYRSPEVILGANWNETADIWSLACLMFELLTTDYLFEPHTGHDYGKDHDHLAQIIELLSFPSKSFTQKGKFCNNFFDKKGRLKKIYDFNPWPLEDVFYEKYKYSSSMSKRLADFMLPMLDYSPGSRARAKDCLNSQFLKDFERDQQSSNNDNGNATTNGGGSSRHA
ncbi:kinase-like protein, partial [Conidiobolus coronatus NRRL 28638]